jgi:hypothetical protein
LQRSAQTWADKQTCSSCHHQALGTFAVATPDGLTALALAQQYGYTHFTQLLRSAGAR